MMQEHLLTVSSQTIEICNTRNFYYFTVSQELLSFITFNEHISSNFSSFHLIFCTHITSPFLKIFNEHNSYISWYKLLLKHEAKKKTQYLINNLLRYLNETPGTGMTCGR